MKRFDQSKPYATVRGRPGVHYEQDGVLYNRSGEPVGRDGERIKAEPGTSLDTPIDDTPKGQPATEDADNSEGEQPGAAETEGAGDGESQEAATTKKPATKRARTKKPAPKSSTKAQASAGEPAPAGVEPLTPASEGEA